MPDIERRLQTIKQAIVAFRDTPGRRGRVVALTEVSDVLVAGDLHGYLENLRRLLDIADLPHHPRRHLVLQEVIHGPFRYPGGGDKSHQLLDIVAALKAQYPARVHFLLGNHELAQATGRRVGKEDGVQNDQFRAGIDEAYGEHAESIYSLYLELFAAAPLAVRTPNRVLLTHSLPSAARLACFNPAVLEQNAPAERELQPGGSIYSLVWGRDLSREAAVGFLKMMDADWLITGHVPCDRGFDFPNDRQVVLDSMGPSGAFCLFPGDVLLNHEKLVTCVSTL